MKTNSLPGAVVPKPSSSESIAADPVVMLLLCLLFVVPSVFAQFEEVVEFPAPIGRSGAAPVQLIGTADLDALRPVILAFQRRHPGVGLVYTQGSSNVVYGEIAKAGKTAYDLVISSAMDLQVKLVNDGYAQAFRSANTERLPTWAKWRDSVFGFTLEPAIIVYDTRQFPDGDIPNTRFDLIRFLRDSEDKLRNRIATYDPEISGLGYLFASQDSLRTNSYWRLMEVLGGLDVRLSCCSGEMLRLIETGEIAIAYNVLGSYALARKERGSPIGMILPSDYTLTMARSALIPSKAPSPDLAGIFIDFLLSDTGQRVLTREARLNGALRENAESSEMFSGFSGQLAPISFGPGLLVFLDRSKRARFIAEWRDAVRRK